MIQLIWLQEKYQEPEIDWSTVAVDAPILVRDWDADEGDMTASEGDYIIKGLRGEFYPCKPDVFEQTYEEATSEEMAKAPTAYDVYNEWIPCSERLPENKVNPISNDYYEYPVTMKFSKCVDVRYYKYGDGHWWYGGQCMDDYVVAWMPKPEPWEGAERQAVTPADSSIKP